MVAVKDRAWPPWGVGAHTVHALAIAAPVTSEGAGLSNVFLCEDDVGNIALVAAVYAELLNTLSRRQVKEITYIVREGSIFAGRVLASLGFKSTEELYLSHGTRYNVFGCELESHMKAMALHGVASPELLDGSLADSAFSATLQLMAATSIGSAAFYTERGSTPEILPNTGGFSHAKAPGGPPITARLRA